MGKVKIFIIAGEHSGDMHGGELTSALLQAVPGARIRGLGGPLMKKAGVDIFVDTTEHTAMGLTEVIGSLPAHAKMLSRAVREIKEWHPDVVVPIDYPDFNLRLAGRLHGSGIPVVYYVSPQVWAWRSGRVSQIKKFVRKMLVIFPFEVDFYRSRGVNAIFVGHPLLDRLENDPPNRRLAADLEIPADAPMVGILPGSRTSVYRKHWPIAWEAARKVMDKMPQVHFVVSLAGGIARDVLDRSKTEAPKNNFYFHRGRGGDVIASSRALLLTSGTSTVEAALLGTPMAVFYKVSPLTYALAKRLVNVPAIAMCNLVAGRKVVDEFIQRDAEPGKLSRAVMGLLNEARAAEIKEGLREVSEKLGESGASKRAVEEILLVTG